MVIAVFISEYTIAKFLHSNMSNTTAKFSNNSSLQGIFFMLINTLSLAFMDISVKILRQDFDSPFVLFVYKFSLLLILLPWILKDGTKYLKTNRMHVHIIRGITGAIGGMCFYHGLAYIAIADASALENVQYLMIFALGSFVFNEKITQAKIIALILGFIGAVIVMSPDSLQHWQNNGEVSAAPVMKSLQGSIFVIAAVIFWSANSIIIKILGTTEHNKTQLFYVLLIACLISFPTSMLNWDPVNVFGHNLPLSPKLVDVGAILSKFTVRHICIFLGISLFYFIHSSAYFFSLKSDLSLVVPFRYTKLVFSAGLGYIVFGETIQGVSALGYVIIIVSGMILVRYEVKRKKWERLQAKLGTTGDGSSSATDADLVN